MRAQRTESSAELKARIQGLGRRETWACSFYYKEHSPANDARYPLIMERKVDEIDFAPRSRLCRARFPETRACDAIVRGSNIEGLFRVIGYASAIGYPWTCALNKMLVCCAPRNRHCFADLEQGNGSCRS